MGMLVVKCAQWYFDDSTSEADANKTHECLEHLHVTVRIYLLSVKWLKDIRYLFEKKIIIEVIKDPYKLQV